MIKFGEWLPDQPDLENAGVTVVANGSVSATVSATANRVQSTTANATTTASISATANRIQFGVLSGATSASVTSTPNYEVNLSVSSSVLATANVVAKIIGEDWSNIAEGSETWAIQNIGSEVWTTQNVGSEVWFRQ